MAFEFVILADNSLFSLKIKNSKNVLSGGTNWITSNRDFTAMCGLAQRFMTDIYSEHTKTEKWIYYYVIF